MRIFYHLFIPFVLAKRLIERMIKFVFERVALHRGHLLRGVIIGFAISVVVTIMAWTGHFRHYENIITDMLQDIMDKKAKDVVLLFITEKEYKQGFNSTSPLSRERLANIIKALVELGPRVIALDIDISDKTAQDHKLYEALEWASMNGIPVVVPCRFKEIDPKMPLEEDIELPYPKNPALTVKGMFKSATPGEQWRDQVMYGGVFFNLDQDGIFRHAKAFYKLKNGDSKGKKSTPLVPNLPITIASAYLGITQQSLEKILSDMKDHTIILKGDKNQTPVHIHMDNRNRITPNFIGNYRYFDRITPNFIGNYRYFEKWQTDIDAILAQYGNISNSECIPGKNTKNISPPLKDKIVLLGGSYDERDFYITPVGTMAGMEVIANITQNIINGDLIKHTARWWAFAIEIFLGTIVALIFILTSRFWATVICFTTLIPVVSIASMLTFSTTYHWFDFVPTISGVTFHGWISKVEQDIKSAKQILGKIAEERKI